MKKFAVIALLLALSVAALAGTAAAGPGRETVHFFVITPPNPTTTVTAEQAREAVVAWVGQPTDEACLGPQCTIEGYFRSQVGKVFEYDVTVLDGNAPVDHTRTDACDQGGIDQYWWRPPYPGYSIVGNRTLVLVLGGGGWAGHNPGDKRSGAFAMMGDWGVQNRYDVPLPCVPDWVAGTFMDRGFAHEFEGMMGMYRNGAEYGYFCCETPMNDDHRRNVLSWSRSWLRNP